MNKKTVVFGLAISVLLAAVAIPFTIQAYLDKSVPFNNSLFAISGVSIVLLFINYMSYKRMKEEESKK